MGCFVIHLPQELCIMIINLLDKDDLLNVSSTCKLCRDELAPIVFRTISFSNEDRMCASALAAAKKYGHLVRHIRFNFYLTRESVNVTRSQPRTLSEAASTDTYSHWKQRRRRPRLRWPVLRPAARYLLRGLHMPALQTFEIVYKIANGWSSSGYDSAVWQAATDSCMVAEQCYAWRALLAEAFRAVSRNHTISELVFTNTVPVSTSAFRTRPFRNLPSRIKSATFHFPDIEYKSRPASGLFFRHYRSFLRNMPLHLLRFMEKLNHFRIDAPPGLPAGILGMSPVVFPLKRSRFQHLKSVVIGHCFVTQELLEFLKNHAHTLSDLVLKNCMVGSVDGAHGRSVSIKSWAQFFDSCYALQPSALTRFAVEYDVGKVKAWRELNSRDSRLRYDIDSVMKWPRLLAARTVLKTFVYVLASYHWNAIRLIPACRPPSIDRIKDNRAYERLLRFVEANAARIKRESRESN